MIFRTEDQSDQQQHNASHCRRIAHLLYPLQIPHHPTCAEEQCKTKDQCRQLLSHLHRLGGRNGGHTQGTQEERQGLYLKGRLANKEIKEHQKPLAQNDAAKAKDQLASVLPTEGKQIAEADEHLHQGQ